MAGRRLAPLALLGRERRRARRALRLQRRRRRRRLAAEKKQAPPSPASGALRAQRDPDAWRDFAASFVAAGLVASPPAAAAAPAEEEPGGGALVAAEAKEGSAVLLLPQGQTLTFTGKCSLTCLYGSVQVFGFNVAQDQPPSHLFSPYSHCALTVKALAYKEPEKSKKEMRAEARSILKAHLVPRGARCKLAKSLVPQCSIVLLEHLDTPVTKFILSHPKFSHMFRAKVPEMSASTYYARLPALNTRTLLLDHAPDPASHPPQQPILSRNVKREKISSFAPEDAALASTGIGKRDPGSGLLMSDSALSAIEKLVQACQEEDEGCPVILVCGSKSVGKSTFNRYLINLLLNRLPCIEFLECDLGQTEFTPPGCVSLINVTEPLLGPPFTHQRTPRKTVYFGETSCEQDTERYIDTLKYVFNAYERDAPLVINTMGWVKGAGLLLLIDILRLLSPSHVVQISTEDFKEMPQLSPDYVRCTTGLHTRAQVPLKCRNLRSGMEECPPPPAGHKLLCVQPQFPGAGIAGDGRTHSSVLRDLAVLGYLGQLQPPGIESPLPLHSLVPYQVPFGAVALKVIHADVAPAHVLYSVNASWVGLCQIPDEVRCKADGPVLLTQTPICDCLGFGIVRGVDMEKKLYYVLTPVAPESLRLVNCLLIGNIQIPNCIFLNQPGMEGEIPYVTSEYNYDISGAGKLKLKKHLKRREHSRP